MNFIFQFTILHLQGFSTSTSPSIQALCNQTLSPCGWGLDITILQSDLCTIAKYIGKGQSPGLPKIIVKVDLDGKLHATTFLLVPYIPWTGS